MIVGITGGIGSGKTTVVSFFKEFKNIAIYLADVEAKKLMNSSDVIKSQLIKNFGKQSYLNNQLNRSFIANIVFNDKDKLAILNAIVHPEVAKHFKNFINIHKSKEYILYENAILFENKSDAFCDVVITVTAPLNKRIDRVMKRDKTNKEAVLQRIQNQWKEEKKILQSNYVIDNLDIETTRKKVIEIHQKLLHL